MRYLTAGESHGKTLVGILEGMPAGLTVETSYINAALARRQQGYGRGGRMAIERDRGEIVAGVRGGVTMGSPIALLIPNRDYENWQPYMDPIACDTSARTVTLPRPGHADFVGAEKFGHDDCRNILERASARNTASIVALGAVAAQFLEALGVRIASYVTGIGGAVCDVPYGDVARIRALSDASCVRTLDEKAERAMVAVIDRAKENKDTVGGTFRVVASGLKRGIGTCMEFDAKLDAMLCAAIGGLQGVKSVSIGDAAAYARRFGSEVHDAMYPDADRRVRRETNCAGGIEGGMTNGEDIVVDAVFKPIPTTMRGLPTVDMRTGEAATSSRERSDVCAVPAAGIVGEALVALTLTEAVLRATGGSNMKEIIARWNA